MAGGIKFICAGFLSRSGWLSKVTELVHLTWAKIAGKPGFFEHNSKGFAIAINRSMLKAIDRYLRGLTYLSIKISQTIGLWVELRSLIGQLLTDG